MKRGEITDEQYDEMTGGGNGVSAGDLAATRHVDESPAKKRKVGDDGTEVAIGTEMWNETAVELGPSATSVGAGAAAGVGLSGKAALLAAVKATVFGKKKQAHSSVETGEGGANSLVRRLHEEHRRQRRHASKSTKKVRAGRQQRRKASAAG